MGSLPTVDKNTKANLTQGSTWLRLVYMILFVVIFNITEAVIGIVMVIQFLLKLFTDKVNAQLQALGASLAAYICEIIGFLTFHSDNMPYPFTPWPKGAPSAQPPAPERRKRPRKPKAPAPAPESG